MRANEFITEGITAAYPKVAGIYDYIRNNWRSVTEWSGFYSTNFDTIYVPKAMINRLTDDKGNVYNVGFAFLEGFPTFSKFGQTIVINLYLFYKFRGMFNRETTTKEILDVMSKPARSQQELPRNDERPTKAQLEKP
jgi:hypothetical protein